MFYLLVLTLKREVGTGEGDDLPCAVNAQSLQLWWPFGMLAEQFIVNK